MLNQSALLKRGWTPALVAAVLQRPDQVVPHSRGYQRWTEHLFLETRVLAGEADPRFVEAAQRRRARAARASARQSAIPEKYRSWRSALADAAAFLFSLNRYAKHRMCSPLQRVEIYTLKNEFLRLLYERGYCTAAWIHRLQMEEQACRECGGAGGPDFDCQRCGGSGVWREAKTVEFWCFRFLIEGRTYCWHQPRASVEFTPAEGLPPQEWEGLGGEKPVALPRRKFAYAKELLRWVIDAAGVEDEDSPALVPARVESAAAQIPLFAGC